MAKIPSNFKLKFVASQIPVAVVYYFIGSCFGTVASFILFFVDKSLLVFVLEVWFKRLTIGIDLLGGHQTLWFIVNNLVALMLVISASVLIFAFVLRKRKIPKRFRNSRFVERHNPRITLYSAYMIPIGALIINGFLVNFFLTYTLLNYGVEMTVTAIVLMMPHGVNEILALLIASSLGLAYLKVLSPMIKKRQIEESIELGKALLMSKTTFFFIFLIVILVVFSGFVEGVLSQFVL